MYLVSSTEMREIDRAAIERIGIPAVALMENAGRAVAEEAIRLAESAPAGAMKRWLVLAGKGNNGGDGVVAARHLAEAGFAVVIVYAVDPAGFAGEAALQRDIAARLGLPSAVYGGEGPAVDWSRFDGVIDALLGTGSRGAPQGPYAALIREANASGLPIVAVDIPSGLDADTGETRDPCIRASRTVALAFAKRGLAQHPGADAAGDVVVRPIGIPERLAEEHGVRTFALDERTLRERLGVDPARARAADTHKGTYGHALVAAGSRPMSGAGLLSARAALRGGCGLVTWAVPESLVAPLAGRFPEAMLAGVPDGGSGGWSAAAPGDVARLAAGKDALVLGPGIGRWDGGAAWLRELWTRADGRVPLVLDADALNLVADAPDFAAWPRRPGAAVFTPHPGEMARLAGVAVPEVQRDRIGVARSYAVRHGVTLVLKGARTVVADPSGRVYVNGSGNAGMATAGSGDVLAGLIGGLLAQRLTGEQAAALGVWLHGAAGDRAAARRPSPASLIAGDIVDEL
ncbi:NAD(P)H-hydrate dehydratase [Paenibacillus flagellatus]|uniref:Bifunctional NAD(P)H-hydrate repair enzyme n=1 Tax=Paenibacillus flagellatus TaxID=2211139 RepID=A0A2V5KAB1_9BACL|nr:NAD(P)H-hydrate dehydratase [Paenibacillus flagellatus]PYI56535.1 bifunctional ADP-dependent NAD(P)H-hydrate dehydratase/NAD(P)H-hydrate epimerase [Paenibacillus flagellatus]